MENRYSIEAFVNKTKDRDLQQGLFELESERMLDINLNGEVWIKMGAMVAYTGHLGCLPRVWSRCIRADSADLCDRNSGPD